MSDHTLTITLPDHIYNRLRAAAEREQRTPEAILEEIAQIRFGQSLTINDLPSLPTLTDAELWQVAELLKSDDASQQIARMSELNEIKRESPLSDARERELDAILSSYNTQVLLRSESLVLLKERGYDVDAYLRTGQPPDVENR